MSKVNKALAKNWDELASTLPDDLDASAKRQGALLRRREVKSAADLLRIVLGYALSRSLRLAVVWAACLGVCDISRQALDNRVHQGCGWLRCLLGVILPTMVQLPTAGSGLIRRLVIRDASVISRPGSPGTEWRLHFT